MRAFSILGGAHIFQLICSLLGTVLIFRSLAPADVGTVVSIVALNVVLMTPLASGFAKVYSGLLIEKDSTQRANEFYWLGLTIITLLAFVPAGLAALFHGDPVYALLAGLMGAMGVHKMNLRNAENAEHFGQVAVVRIGVGLSLLGVKALAALRVDPYLFAASFVMEQAIYYLALPVRSQIKRSYTVLVASKGAWRQPQLRSVAKLLPTEYAAALSLKYPLLMFSVLSMPEAAALYNAATRLPDAFNGLLQVMFSAVRPRAYREAAETEPSQFPYQTTRGFVQKAIWLTVVASFAIPPMMPLLFGDFYREAQLGAALYMGVTVAILMGIVQEVWLISSSLFRLSALRQILGAVSSITLTSLLYLFMGLEGAILGVVLGASVQAVFSNLIFERLRGAFGYQLLLLRAAVWPFERQ